MFKLDDNFLIELGLGTLPPAEKNKMLAHIYETLEMKVGMRLAEKMTNEQLDEFERFISGNDEAGALKWLETNFPNYKQVVAEELEKLKAEIKQVAPQIVAQATSGVVPGGAVGLQQAPVGVQSGQAPAAPPPALGQPQPGQPAPPPQTAHQPQPYQPQPYGAPQSPVAGPPPPPQQHMAPQTDPQPYQPPLQHPQQAQPQPMMPPHQPAGFPPPTHQSPAAQPPATPAVPPANDMPSFGSAHAAPAAPGSLPPSSPSQPPHVAPPHLPNNAAPHTVPSAAGSAQPPQQHPTPSIPSLNLTSRPGDPGAPQSGPGVGSASSATLPAHDASSAPAPVLPGTPPATAGKPPVEPYQPPQ